MTAKPTLGFFSRTEAMFALRRQGKTDREIAAALGVALKTLSALEASAARKRGAAEPSARGRTVEVGAAIYIPSEALKALRPHAERRNLSVNALVRRIVETVADEGMIDAVLDDR